MFNKKRSKAEALYFSSHGNDERLSQIINKLSSAALMVAQVAGPTLS